MAPADSVHLAILQDLQAAVRGINGPPTYHFTVKAASVVLDPGVQITNVPSTELPYVVIEPDSRGTFTYLPSMRVREAFHVLLTARADAPTGLDTSRKVTTWESLQADLEVAVTRDITRGGHAIDTRIVQVEPACDAGAGVMTLVRMLLRIALIRTYGQPAVA